jgi:hypothetical protein
VTFMSNSKNTGFVIDYGSTNPFDHEGATIGGSDRPLRHRQASWLLHLLRRRLHARHGLRHCGNADTQLIISAD